MAITIDATVGGASANSYVTNAEADTLLDARRPNTVWTATGTFEADQDQALGAACLILQDQRWRGMRASRTQALAWPREFVEDPDPAIDGDLYLANDAIPAAVKRAQAELAYLLLSGELEPGPTGLEGIRSLEVGSLAIETDPNRPRPALPDSVRRMIAPYLVGGENTVRLVRG